MLHKLKKRTEGFTIIEVLIVLAIAALILLIVFLAVPALQRNSRNTTLKNDAASIGGGISEFISNNNGTNPNDLTKTGSDVSITCASGTCTAAQAKVNGGTTVNEVTTALTSINASTVSVRWGFKCDGTSSSRATAIYYAVERATGAPAVACLDS